MVGEWWSVPNLLPPFSAHVFSVLLNSIYCGLGVIVHINHLLCALPSNLQYPHSLDMNWLKCKTKVFFNHLNNLHADSLSAGNSPIKISGPKMQLSPSSSLLLCTRYNFKRRGVAILISRTFNGAIIYPQFYIHWFFSIWLFALLVFMPQMLMTPSCFTPSSPRSRLTQWGFLASWVPGVCLRLGVLGLCSSLLWAVGGCWLLLAPGSRVTRCSTVDGQVADKSQPLDQLHDVSQVQHLADCL